MISSFFKSSRGRFSFSMIFSFLAIFHVLQWTFLNIPPFSVFLAILHVLNILAIIPSSSILPAHPGLCQGMRPRLLLPMGGTVCRPIRASTFFTNFIFLYFLRRFRYCSLQGFPPCPPGWDGWNLGHSPGSRPGSLRGLRPALHPHRPRLPPYFYPQW